MTNQVIYSEFHTKSFGVTFKVEPILSYKSKFQQIALYDTESHGKLLTLDGCVMVTEKDEFIYHDMITHLPIYTHTNPKKVLIIGGGDGGTAREVLRHSSIKSVDMVEIDEEVVKVAREYLPTMSCSLDDERLNLYFEDGVEWVKNKVEEYDIIIIDSTDPVDIGEGLFTKEFYTNAKNALKEGGILVNQSESPFCTPEWVSNIYKKLNEVFPTVKTYMSNTPSYPAIWSFGLCFKEETKSINFDESRYKDENLEFDYYNCDIHKGAFALPSFVKKLIK
jgi:spermidine synthase